MFIKFLLRKNSQHVDQLFKRYKYDLGTDVLAKLKSKRTICSSIDLC